MLTPTWILVCTDRDDGWVASLHILQFKGPERYARVPVVWHL